MRQRVLLRWHEQEMFKEACELGRSIYLTYNKPLQGAYITLITTMIEEFLTRPSKSETDGMIREMHFELQNYAGMNVKSKREAVIDALLGVDIPELDEEGAKQPKDQPAPQAEAERANANENEKGKGGEAK